MTHSIHVVTRPKPNWWTLPLNIGGQILVIGIGVALDSEAMQWIGFAFLMPLLALHLAVHALEHATTLNGPRALAIEEARQRLDEIERNAQ